MRSSTGSSSKLISVSVGVDHSNLPLAARFGWGYVLGFVAIHVTVFSMADLMATIWMGPPPSILVGAGGQSPLSLPPPIVATGAGLEPAPPACAGALAVKLPCLIPTAAAGGGNLDMSRGAGHLGLSPMSRGAGHTNRPLAPLRMSRGAVQGVPWGGTGFCFFRSGRWDNSAYISPSHFSKSRVGGCVPWARSVNR